MKQLYNLFILLALCAVSYNASAQNIKTSYFIDNSVQRTALNPALTPTKGYFALPAISGIGFNYGSNTLQINNLLYSQGDKLVTFLDSSISADEVLSNLKANNTIDIETDIRLLGVGFFSKSGRSYWTVDVNFKFNSNMCIPENFFTFAKVGMTSDDTRYSFSDLGIDINAYGELAIGNSRKITDKLTVGAKVKFIAGLANLNMDIEQMDVNLSSEKWEVVASGSMNGSMNGLETEDYTVDGSSDLYFDSYDLDFQGTAGMGFGIDLGAEYQLLDNLKLSAAVLDLGFINWKAEHTVCGSSAANYTFTGFNTSGELEDFAEDFGELTRFKKEESTSRTTYLRPTLNIGAEYSLCNELVTVGLLSSTQFRQYETYSELTVSGVLKPTSWFAAALSYSMIHSEFNTFGCALSLSPCWINLFVGADYMIGEVSTQYVPINQKAANFYFGMAIPLSRSLEVRK